MAPRQPGRASRNLMTGKADLHVHTNHSYDALTPVPALLAKLAELPELNFIAITDHNTIEGAKEAQLLADYFGVTVVLGEEISTSDGHLIGLFLEEGIKPGRPARETLQEIKAQGGVAVAPHPLSPVWGLSETVLRDLGEELDGYEAMAPTWGGRVTHRRALKLNQLHLRRPATGGSDTHTLRHLGRAYTAFPGYTPQDLRRALKLGKTIAAGIFWSPWDHGSYFAHLFWHQAVGGVTNRFRQEFP